MHATLPFAAWGLVSCLLVGPVAAWAQGPTVLPTALTPARNAVAAPRATALTIPFSQAIDPATADSIRVFSTQYGGRRTVAASTSGSTVTLTPTAPMGRAAAFRPGETVRVTVPGTVRSAGGASATPFVYQFTAAATGGTGVFDSGSDIAIIASANAGFLSDLKVGDLDGDGDVDFVVTTDLIGSVTNYVRVGLNNGNGTFTYAANVTVGVDVDLAALGDVDGDGDLDLLTTILSFGPRQPVQLLLNNGNASFGAPVTIGTGSTRKLLLGDVDADGDLDVLAGQVLLNDAHGRFVAGAVVAGEAIGDIDGDGDLDMVGPTETQLNDGHGNFTVGTTLGAGGYNFTLSDLDGDGDLDMVNLYNDSGAKFLQPGINDGRGNFAARIWYLGSIIYCLALGDIDGDGDLDVLTTYERGSITDMRVMLNDGAGNWSYYILNLAGPGLVNGLNAYSMQLADVDNDGDLDLLGVDVGSYLAVRLNGTVLGTTAPQPLAPGALWPNPARATEQVKLHLAVPTGARAVQATVLNALGQEVARTTLPVQAGQAAGELPTAGLPAGVYVVQVQAGGQVISQRLVLL